MAAAGKTGVRFLGVEQPAVRRPGDFPLRAAMTLQLTGTTIRTRLEYWPAFVDTLMIVLIVFVLQNLLQTMLSLGSPEMAEIRKAQRSLKSALEDEFKVESADGTVEIVSGVNLLQVRFSNKVLFNL